MTDSTRANKVDSRPPVEAIYPLSPQQQGILFETLQAPEPGIHIEQETQVLRGALDTGAFQRAWQRVVDRHAILRTAFVWKAQEQPLQVVLQRAELPIEQQDWRGLSTAEQQDRLEAYLKADRERGFELSRAPLLRLALFQTGEEAYEFVRTYHHILIDGWCVPILNGEFRSLYRAESTGQSPQLDPSRSYRDYIAWLKRQDLAEAETFWRAALEGVKCPTPLGVADDPDDLPAAEERYAYAEGRLPARELETLQSRARQHRLTLNSLVQGAWALLLSRYSGQDDVVFGTTVSGRPPELPGVESIVGLFANTLPFRVRVAPGEDLWSWLGEVQARHLEVRRYEYCSTGQVHQWSEVPGSLPLFESLLVYENYPDEAETGGPEEFQIADIRSVRSIGAQTNYSLTLLVIAGAELVVRFICDTRRLDAASLNRIVEQFLSLLQILADDRECSLAGIFNSVSVTEIPRFRPREGACAQRAGPAVADAQTPTEAALTRIWADLLGVRQVSIQDSFLELGGHSLLATQLMSRVRQAFQVNLPLRALFEVPTVAGLAGQIERARRARDGRQPPPMRPVSRDRPLPLSFAQQRLWFLDQLDPGSPVYNAPAGVYLRGPLDVAALEKSFNEILRRHEALRTTFSLASGHPVQVTGPMERAPLPVVDLTPLPATTREARMLELAEQEGQSRFDLARGPLIRAVLVRVETHVHVLLLTMHHIVTDAWSRGVLFEELPALYNAAIGGDPSPLAEIPVQYADFAAWQREWLQGEVLEEQLSYWRRQLYGAPAMLSLPADRARPAKQTFRGARQPLEVSREVTQDLHQLSCQEGVTLFMTLLAAFQTLLYRITGQQDIVVGTDFANRSQPETEALIGFFVNQLPLRTDLAGNPTFRALLRRVREVALGAYAHEDLPFEKLVEALRPERALGHAPIFQVKIVLPNIPKAPPQFAGLDLEWLPLHQGTTQLDLILFIEETRGAIRGALEYNTDLFDTGTAGQIVDQLERLLGSVVAQPDARLDSLELLSERECAHRATEQHERQASNRKRFMATTPKAINLS